MPHTKSASSMELLYEALQEIYLLSREANRRNPLLAEGLDITPFQRIILERDFLIEQEESGNKGPNFLQRTTDAVEKLKSAAEKAVCEIDAYSKQLDPAVFSNITAALNSAKEDIDKKKPGDSFLSKIGSGAGMALKSLFGKEDDPVEEVTALIADVNMFKGVLSGALNTITDTLGEIEFLDEEGNKLEGDALQAKKDEILKMPIGEMAADEEFIAAGFPDVDSFKKAVGKTFKEPSGMFSGFKKLGGALGIGIGGDVPLADYIDAEGVFEDLLKATPEQLGATATEIEDDTGSSPALEQMGEPLQALQQTQQNNSDAIEQMAAGGGAPAGGAPAGDAAGTPGAGGETTQLKAWGDIEKTIAGKIGGSQTILDKLESSKDFQAALKDKLTFESFISLHRSPLSSLLYEVIEFDKVVEIGGGDIDDPVQLDLYTSIAAAINDELGEKIVTNLPGGEDADADADSDSGEDSDIDKMLADILASFKELRDEIAAMDDQEHRDQIQAIYSSIVAPVPGLEPEEAKDIIDNPDTANLEAALDDVSPEDIEKIPDTIEDVIEEKVPEDGETSVEVGKKYSYKSSRGKESIVKALEAPFEKSGKKYFKGIKVEDGKEQSEKQALAYSVTGIQGLAESAAALTALKYISSKGISLTEIYSLSDNQIMGLYYAAGGTDKILKEAMIKSISEQQIGDKVVLVMPEEDLNSLPAEEDEILSVEDMVLADLEGEEIAAEIGPGPISKLEIAKLLKSMPDIVGSGYRATRARRCFRKAINNAAGAVICDENFDRSPGLAKLLVEKFAYDEKTKELKNYDVDSEVAYRLNTLAGLNK